MLETVNPQNLLDYSNSLKYADYLFQTHQYNLASVEFERVVFLEPRDTLAKLKLIQTYRYLNNNKTALEKIINYFPHNLNNLPEDFSIEYTKILLHENQFQKANSFLQTNKTLDNQTKSEFQLGILMMQYQWTEARGFANEHLDLFNKSEKIDSLNKIISNSLNTKYKNPALAASLSVIIPGTGKFYTRQWKDAIFSFLFVSTTSWLTYKSFTNNGISFNSLFIGAVAVSFYSANIYGSSKSAKIFNQKINQSFRNEVEDILLKDKRK